MEQSDDDDGGGDFVCNAFDNHNNIDYCVNHNTLTSANMHLIMHYTALIQHI